MCLWVRVLKDHKIGFARVDSQASITAEGVQRVHMLLQALHAQRAQAEIIGTQ